MEAFEVNYDLIEYHKIKISSDEVKKVKVQNERKGKYLWNNSHIDVQWMRQLNMDVISELFYWYPISVC